MQRKSIQHRLWLTCTPVNAISGPFQRCFNQASSSLENACLGLGRLFSFVKTSSGLKCADGPLSMTTSFVLVTAPQHKSQPEINVLPDLCLAAY